MISSRRIDIDTDRDKLLESHCTINYASESPWVRKVPYDEYLKKWLSTSQSEFFFKDLAESMADERTISELWEDSGTVVGYLWVIFIDLVGFNLTVAEIKDIAVIEDYRRRGIARQMLEYAENKAIERGADIFRSEAGLENLASQQLHSGFGFKPYRLLYEKLLADEDSLRVKSQ